MEDKECGEESVAEKYVTGCSVLFLEGGGVGVARPPPSFIVR